MRLVLRDFWRDFWRDSGYLTLGRSILHEHSRNLLAAVPEDELSWQPHEKSVTLGALAGHIAEAPSWIEAMEADHFDVAAVPGEEGQEYVPFVPSTSAELMGAFEDNAERFVRFLNGRGDDFMTAGWTMSAGDKQLLAMPRDAAIRAILLHHVSHHRGQLTVYLRLLGVEVPPTYGPTADHTEV